MARRGRIYSVACLSVLCGGMLAAQAQDFSEILQTQAETAPPEVLQNQPIPPTPPSMTPPSSPFASDASASRTFSSGLRRPSSRLYDAPNMFGDFFSPGGQVKFQSNSQLFFLDPAVQATLDPVFLQTLQRQLSQDATLQAQQQIIDQQSDSQMEGFVDPALISINVVLPDLNNAIERPILQPVFISVTGMSDMQLGGGTRRTKIIENNHSLPQDRVFLSYNHFHNAISTDEFSLPATDANNITTNLDVRARRNVQSLNRYTLGLEKTFEDGQSSVEFRLPLIGDIPQGQGLDSQTEAGNVGNFSVILKRLFFTTDDFAVAGGFGINLPTGSDASGRAGDVGWEVTNEAVHYLPFVGVAGTPFDEVFYQAFAQLDIAGSGNPTDVSDFRGQRQIGLLNDQTLLFLDATGGVWLYRNPESRLAGVATLLELHYATTVQDADQVAALGGRSNSILVFGNCDNRLDVLNSSVGLHTVLQNGTSIRVGGVFPLRKSDDNRLFDAEVQAAINVPF